MDRISHKEHKTLMQTGIIILKFKQQLAPFIKITASSKYQLIWQDVSLCLIMR